MADERESKIKKSSDNECRYFSVREENGMNEMTLKIAHLVRRLKRNTMEHNDNICTHHY